MIKRCGKIAFDVIIQRYFQGCILPRFYTKNWETVFEKVVSARNDYLREEGEEYECWLFNHDWRVIPCITFHPKFGLIVLTCRDHDKGRKLFMLHCPRMPFHTLPAKHSDQLSPCVMNCRTSKPVKRTEFSTQYQLNEQRGSFNGIDTFTVTDFHRFDFTSILLYESESRALKYRPDTNAFLTQLVVDKVIGSCIAQSKRKEAEEYGKDLDIKKYIRGATYVPLDAAISLLRDLSRKPSRALVDHRSGPGVRVHTRNFRKCWPSFLYPCQVMDSHGIRFPRIPVLSTTKKQYPTIEKADVRLLWVLVSLVSCVEELWYLVWTTNLRTSDWHGWILTFVSTEVFPNITRVQDAQDPFRRVQSKNLKRLVNRMESAQGDLGALFSEIPEVFCLDCDEEQPEYIEIDDELHRVVILYNVSSEHILQPEFEIEDILFKLCYISSTWDREGEGTSFWDGYVQVRHSGENFLDWWSQDRKDKIMKQKYDRRINNFEDGKLYVLAYVRVEDTDMENYKAEFMNYLGGKKNLFCDKHRTSLIASTTRDVRCSQCEKNIEIIRCCTLGCECCLCKKCSDSFDPEGIFYIQMAEKNEEEKEEAKDEDKEEAGSGHKGLEDFGDLLSDVSCDSEEEEMFIEESNKRLTMDDDYFEELDCLAEIDDGLNDFITDTDNPDYFNENDDLEEVDDEHNFDVCLPTTDSGVEAFTIEDKDTDECLRLGGRVILNECCMMLTRKRHQMKQSRIAKHFLQKIVATSSGHSIPLMYPENMMFSSIFYHPGGDKLSGLGAICTPLMSENVYRSGFECIPQHIRTRLSNVSCKCLKFFFYFFNFFFRL